MNSLSISMKYIIKDKSSHGKQIFIDCTGSDYVWPITSGLLSACLLQALEVIRELQKHFPIKRSPMRLRLTVPEGNLSVLMEKLNSWNASIISKDESADHQSVVSLQCIITKRPPF